MKLIQTWTPPYTYCRMCGKKGKKACSPDHQNRLDRISFAIKERKEEERGGEVHWNNITIRKYREVQDLIK